MTPTQQLLLVFIFAVLAIAGLDKFFSFLSGITISPVPDPVSAITINTFQFVDSSAPELFELSKDDIATFTAWAILLACAFINAYYISSFWADTILAIRQTISVVRHIKNYLGAKVLDKAVEVWKVIVGITEAVVGSIVEAAIFEAKVVVPEVKEGLMARTHRMWKEEDRQLEIKRREDPYFWMKTQAPERAPRSTAKGRWPKGGPQNTSTQTSILSPTSTLSSTPQNWFIGGDGRKTAPNHSLFTSNPPYYIRQTLRDAA